jgi:hypothetical protein
MSLCPVACLVRLPQASGVWPRTAQEQDLRAQRRQHPLKDLFVEQVEQIVWRYKLAPETINLPAKPGVPEIQVFAIQLKTPELHRDVLRCIDGAVQFPIIFELTQGQGAEARRR